MFSDEKRFNLVCSCDYRYYWHDLLEEDLILSQRQIGGGSIMFWGAVSWKGKTGIILLPIN